MPRKKLTAKQLGYIERDKRVRQVKIFAISFFVVILCGIFHFQIEDFFLRRFGLCATGLVIEKRYYRRYSEDAYQFIFDSDGKRYAGDSRLYESASIGDSISIVYFNWYPNISRPIDTYFDGDFDCSKLED